MTEISALADRLWVELEELTPESVFQEKPDQFHQTWCDAFFAAMELNWDLKFLRDGLRKRARLPKLPDPIADRAKEEAELNKSQANGAVAEGLKN